MRIAILALLAASGCVRRAPAPLTPSDLCQVCWQGPETTELYCGKQLSAGEGRRQVKANEKVFGIKFSYLNCGKGLVP
jgi:hypothetical protein